MSGVVCAAFFNASEVNDPGPTPNRDTWNMHGAALLPISQSSGIVMKNTVWVGAPDQAYTI
jgi:hypothetical protein